MDDDPGHLLPQKNWDEVVKEAEKIQAELAQKEEENASRQLTS